MHPSRWTTSIALVVLVSFLGLSVGVASADQQDLDGDFVTPGIQNVITAGVLTGGTVSTSARLQINWSGGNHLIPGTTVNFVVDTQQSGIQTALPGGGFGQLTGLPGLTVGGSSITVPTNWVKGGVAVAGATSAVSFPAPATAGSYQVVVKWKPTVDYGNALTGARALNINLSVTSPVPVDTTPPEFVLAPADVTHEATSAAGAIVDYALPIATDNLDPAPVVACLPASGGVFPLGATTVTCTATDAKGNRRVDTFDVTVVDGTAPAITLPELTSLGEATGANGAAVTYGGASAFDTVDGDLHVTCTPGSGSIFAIGETRVTCTATDQAGNEASSVFIVTVSDSTAPALSVPADITAEATSRAGAAVDFTASGFDAVDGDVAADCSPASGSTFAFGVTVVTCTATDSRGNKSAPQTFTVTVADTTKPELTAADVTVEATGPAGAAADWDAPTAIDNIDGALTNVICDRTAGEVLALGDTKITCSATDSHDNTGYVSFYVSVVDTTGPSISALSDQTLEAAGPLGASATYSPTATDIVDLTSPVTCTPVSGATFPLGTTSVQCTATDAAGNQSVATFTVKVVDTTPPVITASSVTVPATGLTGAVATFAASANDTVSGDVSVSCTPASGSLFSLGTTSVDCAATDGQGNTTHKVITVTVTLTGNGYFQPVDMGSVINTVKNGSTVPLKWNIPTPSGFISSLAVVTSFQQIKVSCSSATTEDAIEIVTTGGTSLRYDATANQYIQNWQTPKLPGACYRAVVTFVGGSSISANFKLK